MAVEGVAEAMPEDYWEGSFGFFEGCLRGEGEDWEDVEERGEKKHVGLVVLCCDDGQVG